MRTSHISRAAIAAMIFSAFVIQAVAQPPARVRQRRRNLVEGLLRTLIESQEEEEVARGHHDHDYGPGQPGKPRVVIQRGPLNSRPAPQRPVKVVSATPQMTKARTQLVTLNRACGTLVEELSVEQQYVPQVKPLLADCLSIQAASQVLMQRAKVYPEVKVIRDDCRRLDRKWRVLAHRLKRVRNLNKRCQEQIEIVDDCGTQLCSACDYQPQFDRTRVITLTNSLAVDMRHLTQDVYHEVNTIPEGPQLLQDCKVLYSQVNQSQALARTGSYDDIVGRYKNSQSQWRKLSRQLARCKSERIVHHVHEIEQIGQQFQDQLWIPVEIDMQFIQDLIVSIDADTRGAFSNITLDEFLGAKPLCQAATACLEFRESVQKMTEIFQQNPTLEDLQWDFRSLDVQWTELQQLVRQFGSPQLQLHLDNIDGAMISARQYLGDTPVITQPQLVEVAGDMNQLCHDMNTQVQDIVVAPGYDRNFSRDVRTSCSELQVAIQDLHQTAVTECVRSHMRAKPQADRVLQLWGGVKRNIKKTLAGRCTPEQRRQCLAARNQLEPLMVKLQVVYEG